MNNFSYDKPESPILLPGISESCLSGAANGRQEELMSHGDCQARDVVHHFDHVGTLIRVWQQARKLLLKSVPKRTRFISNVLFRGKNGPGTPGPEALFAGDRVMIRNRGEIISTLDKWNRLGQLHFDDGMWRFCGTEQHVLKPVRGFMDEGKWILRKAKNCVILENCYCEGKMALGQCDRACLFFWRTEWLQKIH